MMSQDLYACPPPPLWCVRPPPQWCVEPRRKCAGKPRVEHGRGWSSIYPPVEKHKLSTTHCNPKNILLAISAFVFAATIGWFTWNGHLATPDIAEIPESVMAMCQPVSLYEMCEPNSWCGIGPRVPSIPTPTASEIAKFERKKFLETHSLLFQDVFVGESCGLAFEETPEAPADNIPKYNIDQGIIDQGTIDQGTIDQGTIDQGTIDQESPGDFAEVACAVLLEDSPDHFIVPVCEVVVQITWSISEFFLGRWLLE